MRLTANPKWNWLRWICFFPVALITNLLGYGILSIINEIRGLFLYGSEGGILSTFVWPILATGMAAYFGVRAGTEIAPSSKKNVAFSLMIIFCVLSGVGLFSAFFIMDVKVIVACIAQILGSIAGHYVYSENIK